MDKEIHSESKDCKKSIPNLSELLDKDSKTDEIDCAYRARPSSLNAGQHKPVSEMDGLLELDMSEDIVLEEPKSLVEELAELLRRYNYIPEYPLAHYLQSSLINFRNTLIWFNNYKKMEDETSSN